MLSTIQDQDLASLGSKYKAIKTTTLPPTQLEAYGSDKHQIMVALVEKLGKPGTSVTKVFEVMGEPDLQLDSWDTVKALTGGVSPTAAKVAPLFNMPGIYISDKITPVSSKQWLIYSWRTFRDFAYFETDDEGKTIVKAGWLNALE